MMNNRFKFRVWNKEDKKMCEAEGVYGYTDESTKGGEVFAKGYKTSFYFPEEVELMQCTGLKDKNGKLIYEGDIVTNGYHNMEVYYNQIDCRFILKKVTKYIIKRFGKGSFEHCYLMDRTEDNKCKDHWYKVIGNIYENPDLLQECE